MKLPLTSLFATVMLLSACGGSGGSFNPFNWFGGGQREETLAVEVAGEAETVDRRGLVNHIVGLNIDRTPGGAIIRATGLPDTQGFYNAELVPLNGELPVDGILTYQFRVQRPGGYQPVLTQQSREVVVAHAISNISLEGVRVIRVMGAQNAMTSRR